MTLKRYHLKRKFDKTPEPVGSSKSSIKNQSADFVIQKHQASHLHWDLRLEFNGVLKSWAVPKEPSIDPKTKRLAVQVEDHPLEYAKFHGEIPKGQYGAGQVEIWDKGTFEVVKGNIKSGDLQIDFTGDKLKGKYNLIKTKTQGKNNWWLFFKAKK